MNCELHWSLIFLCASSLFNVHCQIKWIKAQNVIFSASDGFFSSQTNKFNSKLFFLQRVSTFTLIPQRYPLFKNSKIGKMLHPFHFLTLKLLAGQMDRVWASQKVDIKRDCLCLPQFPDAILLESNRAGTSTNVGSVGKSRINGYD